VGGFLGHVLSLECAALWRLRDNPIVASAVDARYSNASRRANSAKTPGTSPQRSPKLHSVAHEAAIIVSGARPEDSGGQRELFTEETSTILVFENGGVLRLSAAVVPGQLLFITNKETLCEVVAQVARKRDFRPTSCYVEVEFSEPSPGFWGIEFPETPQLVPRNEQQKEAAELVHSAKVISGEPSAPAPTTQEVAALKREVVALREQLKLLQTQTTGGNSSVPAVSFEPASAPRASEALPIEPGGPSFSEGVVLPRPVVRVNRTRPKDHRSPERKDVSGLNTPPAALRIALLSALLLLAVGAAWYWHWIPWLPQPRITAASAAPHTGARLAPTGGAPASKPTDAHGNSRNPTPPGDISTAQPVANLPGTSSPRSGRNAARLAPTVDNAKPPIFTKPGSPAPADAAKEPAAVPAKSPVTVAQRSDTHPAINTASVSASLPSEEPDIIPPKLIKSVRAIASPNALQYFDKGNTATVTLDAVVDATGRVKSMTVLSGPASLRDAAIDALKEYRYQPATLRGKPVAAHVPVAVKFLFEP